MGYDTVVVEEAVGIEPVRTPVVPQSLPQTRRVAVVCAAPHGSVIALTVILEVGSVVEAGVEVHEL